jgi:hypothetical protein
MDDRYLDYTESLARLIEDHIKHGSLFVAFDFDNTVFDYFGVGDEYPKIESLLKFLKSIGMKLILFTGNEGEKLNEIISYCDKRGYAPDYVNENPIMKTRKPYYNILLDDRAGLGEAYKTICQTLNAIGYDYRY